MADRILGSAAIAAGLIPVAGLFLDVDADVVRYRLILFYGLSLVGLTGLHISNARIARLPAWLGFAPIALGFAGGLIAVVFDVSGLAVAGAGSVTLGVAAQLALWLGSIVFGLAVFSIAAFPKAPAVAMMFGGPIGMIGLFGVRGGLETFAQAGVVLWAIGFGSLGLALALRGEGAKGASGVSSALIAQP